MIRDLLNTIRLRFNRNRLSSSQQRLLVYLATGLHLKSHRQLDGNKCYHLHNPSGEHVADVPERDVVLLRDANLIASNFKFPADTYVLTDRGLEHAERITRTQSSPITSVRFLH